MHILSRIALALAASLIAVPVFAQAPSRGWVDVNFVGIQSRQDGQVSVLQIPRFSETATFMALYPKFGSTKSIDFGAGFSFGSSSPIGVGVRFNTLKFKYQAGLSAQIPHPNFFNRSATGTDTTIETLERDDYSIDIFAQYTFKTMDAVRIRAFGGPTYFHTAADRVSDIGYIQTSNLLGFNAIDVTSYESEEITGSAWGFNVGVDVAYFFSRYVGVGGVVRFNQGNITIDDPLSGDEAELTGGRTVFGGGLRLRF